ncbi:MAG: glycosyltransferase family 9 protein [Chlamydiota bacterium]
MKPFSVKNFLLLLLVKILKKFSPSKLPLENGITSRILIVSTTGLGDTLWATPIIRSIKNKHPTLCISLLTTPLGKKIFENNPDISEVYLVTQPYLFSFISLWKQLCKKRIDSIYVFHASQRFILPLLSCLKKDKIIGFSHSHKGWKNVLTEVISSPIIHEVDSRYLLVQSLSLSKKENKLFYFPQKDEVKKMRDFFLSFPQKPFSMAWHPGAKDLYKCWPKECFLELGKKVLSTFNCNLFITGGKGEEKLNSFLVDNLKGAIPVQQLDIREMGAFLLNMNLFLTNDTGPMHLSNALGIPTLALFVPTDPKICGPYGETKSHVLQKKPTCQPCLKRKCTDPYCLHQITCDEVFLSIEKFVKTGSFT